MGKSGQYTVEFLILIVGILFIFIPAIYFLMDYSLETKGEMTSAQIESFGNKIVNEARDIYYRGNFNKEIISLKIPENIKSITAIRGNETEHEEYYLRINYTGSDGGRSFTLPSDVLIITGNYDYISYCYPNLDCQYFYFEPEAIKSGLRDMKLETVSWNGLMAVNISVV